MLRQAVAHECAGKELHASRPISGHGEPLRGFVRRGGFGELHLGRQIDGMAILREDVAGKENLRPELRPLRRDGGELESCLDRARSRRW